MFQKIVNGTRDPPPFMANAILNFHFFILPYHKLLTLLTLLAQLQGKRAIMHLDTYNDIALGAS